MRLTQGTAPRACLGFGLKQQSALEANLLLVGHGALKEAGQVVQLQPTDRHQQPSHSVRHSRPTIFEDAPISIASGFVEAIQMLHLLKKARQVLTPGQVPCHVAAGMQEIIKQ